MKATVEDTLDLVEGDPAEGPLERPPCPFPDGAALPAKAVGDSDENTRVAIVGEVAHRDERVLQAGGNHREILGILGAQPQFRLRRPPADHQPRTLSIRAPQAASFSSIRS